MSLAAWWIAMKLPGGIALASSRATERATSSGSMNDKTPMRITATGAARSRQPPAPATSCAVLRASRLR
jgi:hypothetical protein